MTKGQHCHLHPAPTIDEKQRTEEVEQIVAEFKSTFFIESIERLMTPEEVEYFEDFIQDGHTYVRVEASDLEDWLRARLFSLVQKTLDGERKAVMNNYGLYQCSCGCKRTIEDVLAPVAQCVSKKYSSHTRH